MTKLIIILLIGLTFEAAGVVCLNRGLKQIGEIQRISASEIFRVIKEGVTNPTLLIGVFFEAVFFVALLILMSRATVSFVWPLTSLSFVFTTVAAKFFLREEISGLRWSGVLLIMLGAAVISYSEKVAEKKAPVAVPPPVARN